MKKNSQYKELVRTILSGKIDRVLQNDRDLIECRSKLLEKIKSIRETRKRKKIFLEKISKIKTAATAREFLDILEQKKRNYSRKIPPLKKIPKGPYAHLGPDTRRKLLPVLKKKGLLKLKPRNGPYGVPFTKTSIDSTQFSSLVNDGFSNENRSKAMEDWTWRPLSSELKEEGFPLKFSHMTKFYETCGTDPWISEMRRQ